VTFTPASGPVPVPAGASVTTPLVARSVPVDDPGALVDLLPDHDEPFAWVRRGDGLVGWGVSAVLRPSGRRRFEEAQRWWRECSRTAVVRDEVDLPGSGLVAFGSFGFADEPGDSVLIVPEVVVGRRGDQCWVTHIGVSTIGSLTDVRPTAKPPAPRGMSLADGALSAPEWEQAVAEAVRRIDAGDLEKVVLARDLVAQTESPIDVRWPLARLVRDYPSCWTFNVDGLFGATPEMLVRRERGLVTSRVLAGTIRRTGDDDHDLQLAASLARSSKDLEEHEYAVRSVADALAPHCTSMNVPEAPFVLHLPNVMHLATDVAGVIEDGASSLELAAALHPSAAVGGTPTSSATALIGELEAMDRGRYAGPVGWIDASGDGEWGIALRAGLVDGASVRLFAGCGIVAGSDPADELAEAQAKFLPVRNALQP
jgi:menaquinone-specific isochorismate synthase